MSVIVRGGIPKVVRGTALAVPSTHMHAKWLVETPTTWIRLVNKGTDTIRAYFTKDAFDANADYVELGPSGDAAAILDGPFEIQNLWLLAQNNDQPFELTFGQRII